MKAFGVATLLAILSPMGVYAGLCRPSSGLSSSTTASSESSTLPTDSTTSGESTTSASDTVSTTALSATESTESSSAAADSTTVSTSLLSTATSDAATTTTSAAPQGTEGPNGCCGYPGYFDGHVNALTALADSLAADECTAMCTSDLACRWYIYYQLQDGRFQCNTYGTTPAFVVDETKTTIYYPRECKTCVQSQPPPPHTPSCIADIPCCDEGTLDGTQIQFLGLRSVSATDNCGDECATDPDCTHSYRFYDLTYGYRCGLVQMGSDTVFIPGTGFYQLWYSRGCNLDTCRDQ
ncbi:hypothetical protein BHE90_006595 [Fusarium euwallaceae]|uniref:Apple domain-containing protein n=2 Tax=Fusarium solani species complex TaxID=232080 RepID=A0A430LT59_9HYPO|nr:hypothetical protein CEP51_007613 [Fusarium floridanum]RTE78893.1 hypothetical protein BHE90_006595 [Fusarium euwallaceae]